ncbi:hypothetical protein OH491_11200 [Termitidicoccus mucosus]|uniref:Anti-sigma-28 factor FlgM C-terminal domain-containing protein n=1 Tax=Termitidicoccus mucosus TaxID=1184151 RepID=A0A178IF37_9BACT|nr:hypothetical protein AW736_16165 [Opitutaceae bacterium TSB47]
MISQTSSTQGAQAPLQLQGPAANIGARRSTPGADRLLPTRISSLQQTLTQYPEIRPEVVARGRELSIDPDYPPAHVVETVAGLIASSPDLTETEES